MRNPLTFLSCSLVFLLAACSTMSPEQEQRQAILWDAATQCSAGKGSLKVERIDNEDRVWYTTFQGGGQDVPAFLSCYREESSAKLKAAGLSLRPPSK
jgi:hypothetical protein